MNINYILAFAAGGSIGGLVGFIIAKKYYEKKYEEHIKEMEEYYGKTDEYARVKTDEESEDEDVPAPTKAERLKEMTKKEKTVDYVSYYNDLAEAESPQDDIASEADEWMQKHRDKPPKIISVEDAGDLPEWVDEATLLFYTEDEVLADEDGEEITDPETYIGDALTKYDFIDNDEKYMFVINYGLNVCYEVTKVFASYDDTVEGR